MHAISDTPVVHMQLHPATKILTWLIFAILIQLFNVLPLLAVNILLAALILICHATEFVRLIRRTRWLLLSLLLIYGYASSGEALLPALGSLSPSREGVMAGAMQAWRLATLLAALSVMLAVTSRNDILSGLYLLLRPFRRVGVDAGSIAARIWLTLHYAGQAKPATLRGWRQQLLDAFAPATSGENSVVTLEVADFSWRDILFALVMGILMGLLLL